MSSQEKTPREQGHHSSNAPTAGGDIFGQNLQDPQSKEIGATEAEQVVTLDLPHREHPEETKHLVTLDVPHRECTDEAEQIILAEQPTRRTKLANPSHERARSAGSRSSSTSASTKSSESQWRERELRRVRGGTATVEEIMHLREQSIFDISAEDPDNLGRQARKASINIDVEPPLIVPRDITRRPSPQNQVNLTRDDRQKIEEEFPGATVLYSYPFIIIGGGTAPKNPVSAKGLIFEFYDSIKDFHYAPGQTGNPMVQDPVPDRMPYDNKRFPQFKQIDALLQKVSSELKIRIHSMAAYIHLLVIEVSEDDYDLEKLPGKVAGRIALWGVYKTVWGVKLAQTIPRKKSTMPSSVDDSDYVMDGLSPGVKVCGRLRATSSGALIQNTITEEQRITLANHGWEANETLVFHPDRPHEIGTLTDRMPGYDVALCRLNSDLSYTNAKYFSAPVPTHFMSSQDFQDHVSPLSYFAADGFTTGVVWFEAVGIITHSGVDTAVLSTRHAHILRIARASESEAQGSTDPKDEICGSPVVHQEDDDPILDRGCIGFFSAWDGTNAGVPTADHLIFNGWNIV